MSSYLDDLEKQLRASGTFGNSLDNVVRQDDKELRAIIETQNKLNIVYSEEQRNILEHKGSSVILACAGSGKALANGTKVLTNKGWTSIEKLRVGDIVFDNCGQTQLVMGVFPQGKKRVYNVRFNTGEIIPCCKDHLWTVQPSDDNEWSVLDTLTIKNTIKEIGSFYLPIGVRIFDGNYMKSSSTSEDFVNCVIKYGVDIELLKESIEKYESDNSKLKDILNKDSKLAKGLELEYRLCMDDAYMYAKSEEVKSLLKTIYEYFGLSTHYDLGRRVRRQIIDVEETLRFSNMTCIKVSGDTELFLTEHCIPTHNTTVSTHLIAKRILTGEIKDPKKLIYMTFSKAGATEMEIRMNKVMKSLGLGHIKIDVRTIHSFFYKLLQDFGTTEKIMSSGYGTMVETCKEVGYKYKEDDIYSILNLQSYQINNLLNDRQAFDCVHNDIEGLTFEQYSEIVRTFRRKKLEKKLIDFDDIQLRLYTWAVFWAKDNQSPEHRAYAEKVREYCRFYYNDVYIDEAQDVGKIQFEIIKAITTVPGNEHKLASNLTLIGDDDQCIYEWRGSDPSIIQCTNSQFNIKTLILSTNYRCKSEIVDYAATGIQCNNIRFKKSMKACDKGGSVKICAVGNSESTLCDMSRKAADQIKAWIDEGENPSNIAVLCRNNQHLSILSAMLLNMNIFYTGTEEMKFAKNLAYGDLRMLMDLCDGRCNYEIIPKLFWRFNRYIGKANLQQIANFMNEASLDITTGLWYICKNILNADVPDLGRKLIVGDQAKLKAEYAFNKIGRSLSGNAGTFYLLYKALALDTPEEKFKGLLALYNLGIKDAIPNKDTLRNINTLMGYMLAVSERMGFAYMKEHVRVIEQYETGNMGVWGDKVTLSTIHSAKGREWNKVIMFACDNLSQPSFDKLLLLQTSNKTSNSDLLGYIDEERRLFYVGCTRAKDELILMTSKQPSVFLLESLGKKGSNRDIIKYSIGGGYGDEYKETIEKYIIDEDSKYYYKGTK